MQAQLGFCLAKTGQTEAAIEHLRKGAKLAPTYAPVWEHLGLAYAKQGRHRDAVTAFEHATKLKPNYKQAWEHLAEEYRLVGQPGAAQQAALRAAQSKRPGTSKGEKERLISPPGDRFANNELFVRLRRRLTEIVSLEQTDAFVSLLSARGLA